MNEQTKRKFVKGSAREPGFSEGTGNLINFSVNVRQLIGEAVGEMDDKTAKALDDLMDGKEYVNLTMSRRRDGLDEYKNSHHVYVNEWKPGDTPVKTGKPSSEPVGESEDDDTLPF